MDSIPTNHESNEELSNSVSNQQLLNVGDLIGGRFTVEKWSRSDFTGVVYYTRDTKSKRLVECLLLNLSTQEVEVLRGLRQHIQNVKKINLKSFAATYGIGKLDGQGYIVRQLLEGRSLSDHLNHRFHNNKPFKQKALCSLLVELIQALEALKAQDVNVSQHGLLRPDIIMIQNQQKPRVRLSDVGLLSVRPFLTQAATTVDPWTAGCIPELRGEPTPAYPDLYSIGALLYQMTQLKPFDSEWQHSLIIPETFPQLPDLIEACTAINPQINYDRLHQELKKAAKNQIGSNTLTQDLSQLQERLQQIIHPSDMEDPSTQAQIPAAHPSINLAAEDSITGIFTDMPLDTQAQEVSDQNFQQVGIDIGMTPAPVTVELQQEAIASYVDSHQAETVVAQAQAPVTVHMSDEQSIDMSHLDEAMNQYMPNASEGNELTHEDSLMTSTQDQEALPTEDSQAAVMSSSSSKAALGYVETLHGAELITEDIDSAIFSSTQASPLIQDHSPQPNIPAPPPPPPPSVQSDPNSSRWLVVRDQIDYGPFTLHELTKQLFSEEINLDTEICDIETDERATLGEFDSLGDLITAWANTRLEREEQKRIREAKRKAKRRLILTVAILSVLSLTTGAVMYGPQLYESTLPKPVHLQFDQWIAKASALPSLKHIKESAEAKAERLKMEAAGKARRAALKDAKDMAREAREAGVSEYDLGSAKKSGRRFSRREFDRVISKKTGPLTRCVQQESKRSPELSKLSIQFSIQPSGRFLNARFKRGSNPGNRCVFKVIRGSKVKPFDGTQQEITLEFKVK